LTSQIKDGNVQEMRCPHVDGGNRCPANIKPEELRKLVPETTYAKFQKFRLQQANAHYRECPKCAHMSLGSPKNPDMKCGECGYAFCFDHADAHPDVACSAYRKARHENPAKAFLSRVWKWAHTKRCPHCHVAIEKNGGCPNMLCENPQCRKRFCWFCLSNKKTHSRFKKVLHHKKSCAACVIGSPVIAPAAILAAPVWLMVYSKDHPSKRKTRLAAILSSPLALPGVCIAAALAAPIVPPILLGKIIKDHLRQRRNRAARERLKHFRAREALNESRSTATGTLAKERIRERERLRVQKSLSLRPGQKRQRPGQKRRQHDEGAMHYLDLPASVRMKQKPADMTWSEWFGFQHARPVQLFAACSATCVFQCCSAQCVFAAVGPIQVQMEASSSADSASQSGTEKTAETVEWTPVPPTAIQRRPTAGVDRLRAYYVKHGRGDMIPKVETVLKAFQGREHVLCHKLKCKYGDWPAL
jgi:hypothetical protein